MHEKLKLSYKRDLIYVQDFTEESKFMILEGGIKYEGGTGIQSIFGEILWEVIPNRDYIIVRYQSFVLAVTYPWVNSLKYSFVGI